jgi:hypothetical protein
MRTQKFPKIIGVNQLADETNLVDERQMFVRKAANVDIDSSGNVSRRKGASQILSQMGYHSLYSTARGWLMLCRNSLLGILQDGAFQQLAQMNGSLLTSYTELNGNLYASNSTWNCMFLSGSADPKSIGVPLPLVNPVFSATTGGLAPGTYGITYTVVNPTGEESGTGPVTTVALPNGGGIIGTLFTVMSGYKYRIYMTTADGEVLYLATEFVANTTSTSTNSWVPAESRVVTTHGLCPPPFGHIIRAHGARLLIGSTNYVYYTEAFRPHLFNPTGYIPVSGFTTMVESVDGGVFIGDNYGVSFLSGDDPAGWQVKGASPDRAIFGTSTVLPGDFFGEDLREHDRIAVWLTTTGYQLGLPNGDVMRLNADQVSLPTYSQGSVAALVANGRKQLITPVNSNVLAGASVALDSTIN